jgi:glycosyltransferase involved in cell wall biosynthesis
MDNIKHTPKVSVIIPVYNSGRFLEESLGSILNQSFSDFEIIIVDNGSTDNSKEIENKYKKMDKRIYIKKLLKPNVQEALNEGLKLAKGKYIARMDADDISLPNRFEIQVDYLDKHPDIFLIGSSAIIINEQGDKLGVFSKYNNPSKIKRRLKKSNCFIHPSIMFRNSKEFFYRVKFKTSEDYDFYLRMLTSNKKISNLPNFLIKYRITKNSFVSTMPNQDYYFKKAQEFYFQRTRAGIDDYTLLSPPKENSFPRNYEKNSLNSVIFIQLSDGQGKKVRKNISLYFKKYGIDKKLISYHILSFFPFNFIRFIQSIF